MPIAYPYRFSDWYGYDKDCATLTSFSSGSGQTDVKFICNQVVNTTKYHDGSGTSPQVNDNVLAKPPPPRCCSIPPYLFSLCL